MEQKQVFLDRNEFNYPPSEEVVQALKNFDVNKLCFYTRIYDEGKKAYRPIKSGETAAAYLESAEGTGVFNIVGLDAGTYYLVEEKAPTGYNELEEPIIIVIDATHSETSATSASVTFTEKTSNVNNTIKNYNGTTLPETGGIGTTIFYVVGSVLVIGAAVLLVTKKRMSAEG